MASRRRPPARAVPGGAARGALGGLAVLLAACGGGGGDPAGAPDPADAADAGADTGAPPTPAWTRAVLDEGEVGRHVRLAVGPGGEAWAAWFATAGVAGPPCDALGADPPPEVRWPLRVAHRPAGGGAWATETAADVLLVGQPQGLDLARDPAGAPVLATLSGDPVAGIRYCGASDVGLYRPAAGGGPWTVETAVATSGEAATGQPASDYGDVVGWWPALAFDADGRPAVAYKDVHSGSLQSDDLRRADLELAWKGAGGWRALPVDPGRGAGSFNRLAFDAAGRPVIAWYNPRDDLTDDAFGLWVARSPDGGATWEAVRLHRGRTTERPGLAVHPEDGAVWVAWYHVDDRLPYVARLVDDAAFASLDEGWEVEAVGDFRFDEGEHPDLAVAPDGRVAVAYRRCARLPARDEGCAPADDAVVLAWREDGAWERQVVDAGEAGPCGAWTALAIAPDGAVTVAYQCSVLVDGALVEQVRAATRAGLP